MISTSSKMRCQSRAPAQHCTGMTNWPNNTQCLGSGDIISLDIRSAVRIQDGHKQPSMGMLPSGCLRLHGEQPIGPPRKTTEQQLLTFFRAHGKRLYLRPDSRTCPTSPPWSCAPCLTCKRSHHLWTNLRNWKDRAGEAEGHVGYRWDKLPVFAPEKCRAAGALQFDNFWVP